MGLLRTAAAKTSALTVAEADTLQKRNVVEKLSSYTVLISNNRDILQANHASTPVAFTLPDAATVLAAETGDFRVSFSNIGAATATIDPAGTDTLLAAQVQLSLPTWASVTLQVNSAGDGFYIVARTGEVGAVTGTFTGDITGDVTGDITGALNGILGGVTPAAASVTTLAVNGDITTDADGTDSIGATAKRWLKGWFDSLTVTGDVGAATGTFTGEVTGTGFTGTLDGVLGGGTPAAMSATTGTFSGEVTGTGFTGTLDGILGGGTPAAASVTTLGASGASTLAAISGTTVTASGIVSVDDTTDSTSGTTGSIHTDGGLGVAKSIAVGTGILFPDTAVPSSDANMLDDYQEGEFTPTMYIGGSSAGITLTSNTGGNFVKIGRLVTCNITVHFSDAGAGTGAVTIRGWPFDIAGDIWTGVTPQAGFTLGYQNSLATSTGPITGFLNDNANNDAALYKVSSGNSTALLGTDLNNTFSFYATLSYQTAE